MKVRLVGVKKFYVIDGLKEECAKANISFRKLAKNIGISPAYLCDLSKGRRYISQNMLNQIKKELSKEQNETKTKE